MIVVLMFEIDDDYVKAISELDLHGSELADGISEVAQGGVQQGAWHFTNTDQEEIEDWIDALWDKNAEPVSYPEP